MHADKDREMETSVHVVDTNSTSILMQTLPTPHLYANMAESSLSDDFRNIKKIHLAHAPIPKYSSH